ncbi:unnamed protein product [Peronospora farinosa]|uniref:Uncharacterized protein n=1 Tax=Peronospora farinosa TaxID=134698 RepID=A0AAV0UB69_9STRA|nr:unnamed protein product [Peronospora farinosa]
MTNVDSTHATKFKDGKDSKGRLYNGNRMYHNTMYGLFLFIVMSCAIGLICIASLVQYGDLQLPRITVHNNSATDGNGIRGIQVKKIMRHLPEAKDEWASSFECVGWKAQQACSPNGGPDPSNDRACNVTVRHGESGFCEVRHKTTGEVRHVMKMHCDSLCVKVKFKCEEFASLMDYARLSTEYVHDSNFSFIGCQQQLVEDQLRAAVAMTEQSEQAQVEMMKKDLQQLKKELRVVPTPPFSYTRGITIAVYKKLLQSVYASVRSLRDMGCTLPIELWYKRSEVDVAHPLLRELTERYGTYMREMKDPRAVGFYTKLYAIYYSAFDQVLLLDADNFAVRDPTFLFDTPQFQNKGAIFWPDFWKPSYSTFNIQKTSYVWEFFGLDYVDMFEQESGQVLINRRMHYKALNVLMYYGYSLPRTYLKMRLVWGDKDLFRFAWLKSKSSFYMIPGPPGSAGTKHADYDLFCGVTMVQHDLSGRVLFLHRNAQKLTLDNNRILWTHIQQFNPTSSLLDYKVRGSDGGKAFPQFRRCYGKAVNYEKLFTLKPMSANKMASRPEQISSSD